MQMFVGILIGCSTHKQVYVCDSNVHILLLRDLYLSNSLTFAIMTIGHNLSEPCWCEFILLLDVGAPEAIDRRGQVP